MIAIHIVMTYGRVWFFFFGKSMIEIHSLYLHFKHRLDQYVNLNCAIKKFESNNIYLSTETIHI